MSESLHPYKIEAELGSLEIVTHILSDWNGRPVYSVANDYFEHKNPMQRFQSPCMEELELQLSGCLSYRPVTEHLNRIRQQSDGIKTTTLRNTVENQGKSINSTMHAVAEEALQANGFTKDGEILQGTVIPEIEIQTIDEDEVLAAAATLGLTGAVKVSDYEKPEQTINISADDVLSDRQASNRPNSPEKGKKKYVSNTIVHVQKDDKAYIINDGSIKGALKLLMGFLLSNSLIGLFQFVFFTDGASDLNKSIGAMFGFLPYKIILDWYHLEQKLKQRLSLAMKGRKIRNAFLELLQPVLWRGDVPGAIAMLKALTDDQVKSWDDVTSLINYLERNENYIPCYMLRFELGLRNSSNCVENANGRVVSFRQKSQGMSWSKEGSTALASVNATRINGEIKNWTERRTLRFSFDDSQDNAA